METGFNLAKAVFCGRRLHACATNLDSWSLIVRVILSRVVLPQVKGFSNLYTFVKTSLIFIKLVWKLLNGAIFHQDDFEKIILFYRLWRLSDG